MERVPAYVLFNLPAAQTGRDAWIIGTYAELARAEDLTRAVAITPENTSLVTEPLREQQEREPHLACSARMMRRITSNSCQISGQP